MTITEKIHKLELLRNSKQPGSRAYKQFEKRIIKAMKQQQWWDNKLIEYEFENNTTQIYKNINKFDQSIHMVRYFKIIKNARLKNNKSNIKYELHHIYPKSIFPEYMNLNKNKWNGVLLTPREHFICHKLLMLHYKISNNLNYRKMFVAFYLMSNEFKNNSKKYNDYKKELPILAIDTTTNKIVLISKNEFKDDRYHGINKGLIVVMNIISGNIEQIFKCDYNENKHIYLNKFNEINKNKTVVYDLIDKITKQIPCEDYYIYDNYISVGSQAYKLKKVQK